MTEREHLEALIQRWRGQADGAKQAGRRYETKGAIASAKECYGQLLALTACADELAALVGASLSSSRPPAQWEPKIGELRVDVYYGLSQEHHVQGPMGLYPCGVAKIMRAASDALDRHAEIEGTLASASSLTPSEKESDK